MFTDPLEYLTAELQRLDLLLHREILRLRAAHQLSLDEFRGLYISDEQVNSLIDRSLGYEGSLSTMDELTQQAEALHKANAEWLHTDQPWRRLAAEFGLTLIEQDILLLAVAPEIDLKYETLYAYLNNDITRKWPTRDLALRLLATDSAQKLRVRRYLTPESTLFSTGLLHPIQAAPQRPSWLADGFSGTPALSSYLLGLPYRDPRLSTFVEQCEPSTSWEKIPLAEDKRTELRRIVELFKPPLFGGTAPLLLFEGRYGAGAWETAEALCLDLGVSLLRVDLEAARTSGEPLEKLLQALVLQSRLRRAGIYLDRCEALFDKEGSPLPEAYGLVSQLASPPRKNVSYDSLSRNAHPENAVTGEVIVTPAKAVVQKVLKGLDSGFRRNDEHRSSNTLSSGAAFGEEVGEVPGSLSLEGEGWGEGEFKTTSPVFLACAPGTNWRELLKGQRVASFRFEDPDYATRLRLWRVCVAERGVNIPGPDMEALADRFVLTPGQIRDAVTAALDTRSLSTDQPVHVWDTQILFAAARAQSDQNLGNLAVKVNTIHTWDDLVLPPSTRGRVKEVTAAIKYRHIVYSDWGFERRIAMGKGLKVLFAGASGTGKTMTAGVMAKDLNLDLYKIDLSGIVSKYIGETEKNLDRIFRAAHCSNAILFFDEADALFGKRSEVKDAHDRYANIEVAYLLQRMEEYEGVVILASNLSKNIDQAFSRRMHYVVEFPLPDENHREQLWRGMFPPEAPLGKDVDFHFLAKQFSIAGGDIRNVALDAAFLAAQDGQVVTMKQLIKAMARQMMKQGRIPSPTEFKQYHGLIAQGE